MALSDLGRTLVMVGVVVAVLGGVLMLVGQVPWLGRLPGDISIERGNFRLYAPIATMLLLSLICMPTSILTLIYRVCRSSSCAGIGRGRPRHCNWRVAVGDVPGAVPTHLLLIFSLTEFLSLDPALKALDRSAGKELRPDLRTDQTPAR